MPVARRRQTGRQGTGNQVLMLDEIERRLLDGHDVGAGEDANVRHERRRRHAPAVAVHADVQQHVDEQPVRRRKARQHLRGGQGHAFLKGAITAPLHLQRPCGTDQGAMLAELAVVKEDFQVAGIGELHRAGGAVFDAGAAGVAERGGPVDAALQRVQVAACVLCHAAHGEVL